MNVYNEKKREVRKKKNILGQTKREPDQKDVFAFKGKERDQRKQNTTKRKNGKIKKRRGFHNLFGLIKEKERDRKKPKKKPDLDLFGQPMF